MKTTQSSGTRPVHQTVAGGFEFKSGGKAIVIEFTDQHLSPHAGTATFWGWLRPLDWVRRLTEYAMSPPRPAAVITRATVANSPSSMLVSRGDDSACNRSQHVRDV